MTYIFPSALPREMLSLSALEILVLIKFRRECISRLHTGFPKGYMDQILFISIWRKGASLMAQWVKDPHSKIGDVGSIPGDRNIPREVNGNPPGVLAKEISRTEGTWEVFHGAVGNSWI